MNTNMQGHNHGGKSHLIGMLGIGALVLVVLIGTGRSFQEALPLAALLACPLMMIGMMSMMRGGNRHRHGNDATYHRDRDVPAERHAMISTTPSVHSNHQVHSNHHQASDGQ